MDVFPLWPDDPKRICRLVEDRAPAGCTSGDAFEGDYPIILPGLLEVAAYHADFRLRRSHLCGHRTDRIGRIYVTRRDMGLV